MTIHDEGPSRGARRDLFTPVSGALHRSPRVRRSAGNHETEELAAGSAARGGMCGRPVALDCTAGLAAATL